MRIYFYSDEARAEWVVRLDGVPQPDCTLADTTGGTITRYVTDAGGNRTGETETLSGVVTVEEYAQ